MEQSPFLMTIVVFLAYIYAFVGGLTDAANAIATCVGSRVLSFRAAVIMAGVCNAVGGLTGTAVAVTIAAGIIDPSAVTLATLAAGLSATMVWSVATYFHGIPVSETHGLVGGLMGAGVATAGTDVILWLGVAKVLAAIVVSPALGFLTGFAAMTLIRVLFSNTRRSVGAALFTSLQRGSAAFMAFSHGRNDAQKPMGVIALALMIYFGEAELSVPRWVVISCALVAAIGTALGGWRIIKTLGLKLTPLRPVEGFAAEMSGAAVIQVASQLGIPISTTHAISSSIVGVGVSRRKGGVRWVLAQQILTSWLLTMPVTFSTGYLFSAALQTIPG